TQQILHKKMAFFSGHKMLKKTKRIWVVVQVSFRSLQKDKTGVGLSQNVFLKLSKRQKRIRTMVPFFFRGL
ncbi:hypothetical protein WNX13_09585, partial [Lactobacillus delbrueckii]|uniref:hypothetical protein n=1 Tax=Lactobacillus delbrueckii TaxID=1584 RepID=UPI0030EA0B56